MDSGSGGYAGLGKQGAVPSWTTWFNKWRYLGKVIICNGTGEVTCSLSPELHCLGNSRPNWCKYTSEKWRIRDQKSWISTTQGKIGEELSLDNIFCNFFTVAVSPFYTAIWNRHCQNTVNTVTQSGSHPLGRNSRCPTVVRALCQIITEASVWYEYNTHPSKDWWPVFRNALPPEVSPSSHQCASASGDYLQDVVPLYVTEVSHSYLCPHIPAIERTPSKLQASHLEKHVCNSRQRVPLQIQLLKPFVPVKQTFGPLL